MAAVTRDNHYVPQALLRRWSLDDLKVWAYRTLVSDDRVPRWEQRSISEVAFRRDLYTGLVGGAEVDDFERWIEAEFETPGFAAAERAVQGLRLSPDHWHSLIRLYAAQNVRTPPKYLSFMRSAQGGIQSTLDAVIAELPARLAAAQASVAQPQLARKSPPIPTLRVRIDAAAAEGDQIPIRAELTAGRALWIWQMQVVLQGMAMAALLGHRWSILTPHESAEWPLTDNPAANVRIDRASGQFVDGAGWGEPGALLFMPLSPEHLLFVEVGKRNSQSRRTSSATETTILQELLVADAHRWVFGTTSQPWVHATKPRRVDAAQFEDEQSAWRNWHSHHSAAEATGGTQPVSSD